MHLAIIPGFGLDYEGNLAPVLSQIGDKCAERSWIPLYCAM